MKRYTAKERAKAEDVAAESIRQIVEAAEALTDVRPILMAPGQPTIICVYSDRKSSQAEGKS